MFTFPEINPVAIQLGPLAIRWYGLMYIIGLFGAWGLAMWRVRDGKTSWKKHQVEDLIFYCAVGIIVGGRIGYILFYSFLDFIHDPMTLLRVWEGGMSFHGGFIGVVIALWLFSKKSGKGLIELADFVAPLAPLGLGAGRIGNFINGELWGRVTDVPWAMVFPHVDSHPRHPSQFYEFLLEGVAMFLILWIYSAKPRPKFTVSGLFLICYGVFRFSVEFFRVPDPQVGYLAFNWLTMGQLLSLPMIMLGIWFFVMAGSLKCKTI